LLGHYSVECGFGDGFSLRPDPVTPIDFFNGILIADTISEGEVLAGAAETLRSRSNQKAMRE